MDTPIVPELYPDPDYDESQNTLSGDDTMAISTYQTYLGKKSTGSTYEKLVDIKSFPDLGQAPNTIAITTLSDRQERFIKGIKKSGELTFRSNYTKADMTTLKALEDASDDYGVFFGDMTGTDGKVTFSGELSVRITGGGVDEAVEMEITIVPSTELTWA